MNNSIYLRRAGKVAVNTHSQDSYSNFANVASLDANLRSLGYALDNELAMALIHEDVFASKFEVEKIHTCLVSTIKEMKGVRNYRPMYPNFPKQVMESSEAELYLNAIMHYFGDAVGLRILPIYDETTRPVLEFDEYKITLIRLGSEVDFIDLMANLMSSKSAFSETDKSDLAALDSRIYGRALSSVDVFQNRENKAWLANQSILRGLNINKFSFDTATDVLRLAAAMSDGDVSLAENTNFRSFRRQERRLLLSLLNKIVSAEEDMNRNTSSWKRLGERLHPGEFSNKFPRAASAFQSVRVNGAIKSFNSRVEAFLKNDEIINVVDLLVDRPGEFARRLDNLLRSSSTDTVNYVLTKFEAVSNKVSPTVLIQARNEFLNRNKENRVFFPKGSVAKMQIIADERPALSVYVIECVLSIIETALYAQFKNRDDLGGSWIDPCLKRIAVPFGQRSASKALKTLARGSRLSMAEDAKFERFFIWWKDGPGIDGRTDIDLSAVFYNENYDRLDEVTYYNLRNEFSVHSGDITSAPKGASEFIDVDIDKALKAGVRYVSMVLNSYTQQNFCDLPECFAGFMGRNSANSGEIYDPRTVVNKVDIASAAQAGTPFIFDLVTREAIWVDLSVKVDRTYINNVASNTGVLGNVMTAMTNLTPPNLYDLFSLHASARGGLVTREQAKHVFSFDGDTTPFDTEDILANYL